MLLNHNYIEESPRQGCQGIFSSDLNLLDSDIKFCLIIPQLKTFREHCSQVRGLFYFWLTLLSIRSLVSSPGMSIITLLSLLMALPSLWLFPSFIITNSLRPRRSDWDRRATPLSSPAPEKNEAVYCFFQEHICCCQLFRTNRQD